MVNISFFVGDLARTLPSEALIVPINSPDGSSFGDTGRLIQQAAGSFFEDELHRYMQDHYLPDGQTLRVKGGKIRYERKFNDILYIKDELNIPLKDLIYKALTSARHEGYHQVTVPLFRMGVVMSKTKQSEEEDALEMLEGIHHFAQEKVDMDIVIALSPSHPQAFAIFQRHIEQYLGIWDGQGFITVREEL